MVEWFRFTDGQDYRSKNYWEYRHSKYGFDLRGVGDKTKSHEENVMLLNVGTEVFLKVCRQANVLFKNTAVLDIGCGTGHFTNVLRQNGVQDYLGIDIVDTLFVGLYEKFPEYNFQQVDVSTEELEGTYDLIVAMDVLQHITDEEKFTFALENIKSHLSSTGTIIISTHLGPYERKSFYLVYRPFELFEKAFPGFIISPPSKYADSFVFSLRREEVDA